MQQERQIFSKLSQILLLISSGIVLTELPGLTVALAPTSGSVILPPTGTSNNVGRNGISAASAFVDDIILDTITFSGVTFSRTQGALSYAQQATVTSGREYINAEYGDSDTGSDANPNPYVAAGIISEGTPLSNSTRESTDPAIQDRAITAAFNSLSLAQGIDGESAASYAYQAIFQQGIVDNNLTVDSVPEIVFFERGVDADFTVQVITGGTFALPIFAPTTITVARANLTPSGFFIDTIEIPTGEQLGVVGFDLNDFGLIADEVIYGVSVTSINNSGADIYGQVLTAENTSQFRPVPSALSETAVPEPATIVSSIMALGVGIVMKIYCSRSKKTKQAS